MADNKPSMMSQELEVVLHMAFVDARQKRHQLISVEHLLLALLDSKQVISFFSAFHGKIDWLKGELARFIEKENPPAEVSGEVNTQPTIGFQRVIQRAILHIQTAGKGEVTPLTTLAALYGEKDSHAILLLHQMGISRLDVVAYLADGIVTVAQPPSIEQVIAHDIANLQSREPNPARISQNKPLAFISYAHVDVACLHRLLVHLKPLHKQGYLEVWADTNIKTGDRWKKQIQEKLDQAAIAVLLISADFLASDFIVENELPPILAAADAKGVRILPVILKPCGFHRDELLSSFQALNAPSQPLLGMHEIEQEKLYNALADEIYKEIKARLVAKSS